MTEQKKSRSDKWIQGAGLVAAIVAILVTVFFSIRSERSKELSITILAKRPLLSVEASTPNSGLEVRLKGEPVTSPWLVSLKVENTGELSIEERDIESPLKLLFQGGKPISAETQSRSDRSISSTSVIDASSITIRHKLLNPGDWIAVDILFDGEPSIPPTALTRISGVTSPKTFSLKPTPDNKKRFIPFGLPIPVVYTALVLVSALALVLAVGGIALAYQTTSQLVTTPREKRVHEDSVFFDVSSLRAKTREGRIIHAALADSLTMDLLQDTEALSNEVAKIPYNLLSAIDLHVDSATKLIRAELIESLKSSIASRLFYLLPNGKDKAASDAMRDFDTRHSSPVEVIEKGESLLKDFGGSVRMSTGLDKSDLLGAFGLVIFGFALALVSLGGWSVVLG